MHQRDPSRICNWCDGPIERPGRKYCSPECLHKARLREVEDYAPTPEEIREMCRQIREEGGKSWERSRACFHSARVETRTVRLALADGSRASSIWGE